MPSVILHTMFGEDVVSGLFDEPIRAKMLNDYRSAFVLGCQGPDIFYHSQRLKPAALEYGSLLHRRGCGVFTYGLLEKGLPTTDFNMYGAYALGFMTHAVLDRFCHPYIIYHCGGSYHSFFERIIDVLMLKKLRGLDPACWDQERLLAEVCENPPPRLKDIIFQSLAASFPERVNNDRSLTKRLDNAFADCARFYNMTSPAKIKAEFSDNLVKRRQLSRRALNYVYPENIGEEIDFLNLKHKPWRYPHIPANGQMQQEDSRSFLEIYADAVKAAIDAFSPIITHYLKSGTFPAMTVEKIGNHGLSILDENGRPCAPNLTDPLPLGEVLEQQRKLRGVE